MREENKKSINFIWRQTIKCCITLPAEEATATCRSSMLFYHSKLFLSISPSPFLSLFIFPSQNMSSILGLPVIIYFCLTKLAGEFLCNIIKHWLPTASLLITVIIHFMKNLSHIPRYSNRQTDIIMHQNHHPHLTTTVPRLSPGSSSPQAAIRQVKSKFFFLPLYVPHVSNLLQ